MIVYQEDIQVEPKPMIWLLDLIGSRIYTIVLFDSYAIVMSVADPNLLDKNTKGGYDRYHHQSRDGEMFLLIM